MKFIPKKPNIWVLVACVLAVLLFASVVYICVVKYKAAKQGREKELLTQGYEYAIYQLMQQAVTCQPVSVSLQNQTIQMIAVECLQMPQGSANLTGNASEIQ